jgi:hypothetical protein
MPNFESAILNPQCVMLNLVQHLTKSMIYETLKAQGDKSGLFTSPLMIDIEIPKSKTLNLFQRMVRNAK